MKIIVIGGTGTIGTAVVAALRAKQHEIIVASRKSGDVNVDITDKKSIERMLESVGSFDALVSTAGGAAWKPLADLTDEDFEQSLHYKLMGQINLYRAGVERAADRGSFTLTSGILAQSPMRDSAAVSLVNAGLEGFVRAAALNAPRAIRINVISPPWVSETLVAMGQSPDGGLPADVVAKAYVASVEGAQTGEVIHPS